MRIVDCVVALLLCGAGAAAAGPRTLQGLRLDDALRLLQRDGLPIVFSSEIVTPRMRVTAEPRATSPRQQLDEILAPNGLSAESGPGGVILVVRAHTAAPTPAATDTVGAAARGRHGLAGDGGARPASYSDHVTVSSTSDPATATGASRSDAGSRRPRGVRRPARRRRAVGRPRDAARLRARRFPERLLGARKSVPPDRHCDRWRRDPVAATHRVRPKRSRLGLDVRQRQPGQRDAPGRRVSTPLRRRAWRAARAEPARGLARVHAHHRHGGRDDHRRSSARARSARGRGSWIAGVRDSYRSWPPGPHATGNSGFGFADLHAKLVYDVSPTQQVSVTRHSAGSRRWTRSTSCRWRRSRPAPKARRCSTSAGVRRSRRARSIRQRLFAVGQDLSATLSTGQVAGGSSNRELGYRGEVQRAGPGRRARGRRRMSRLSGRRDVAPSGSGAVPYSASRRLDDARRLRRFRPGVRSRPVIRAWRPRQRLDVDAPARAHSLGAGRLAGSRPTGRSMRPPERHGSLPTSTRSSGSAGPPALRPERATHVDVGIEQRLSTGIRWQATLFNRLEQDVLRGPDPVLAVQTTSVDPLVPGSYRNALSGRGARTRVRGHAGAQGRLSGWLSYTYAVMRQHDVNTQETFWSDFDRRHTFNAAGMFRIGAAGKRRRRPAGRVGSADSRIFRPAKWHAGRR